MYQVVPSGDRVGGEEELWMPPHHPRRAGSAPAVMGWEGDAACPVPLTRNLWVQGKVESPALQGWKSLESEQLAISAVIAYHCTSGPSSVSAV